MKTIRGFTLIELIVVIGIIGILMAIVIIAVNPARQFAQARNAQRVSNTRELYNALSQVEGESGESSSAIPLLPKVIGTNASSDPTNYVDLQSVLQNYIASIPVDPTGGSYAASQYVVFKTVKNHVVVLAPAAELDAVIRTGAKNYSLWFDGSNDSVRIPGSVSINPSTAFTYALWAKKLGAGSAEPQNIILDRGSNSLNLCSSGQIRFTLVTSNGTTQLAGGSCPPTDEWNHYVITYDGSTAKLFYNGQQIATTSASGTVTNSGDPLTIGGDFSGSSFFQGLIGDVRIYNRALSQSEITAIHTGFPENDGLAGYWTFDEGEGTTANDISGNNNTGTLMNGNTAGNGTSTGPLWTN